MATVAPASPMPVTTPPVPSIAAVRPVGAVMSGAVACAIGETLPAGSAWVSVTIWPLAWTGVSGAEKLPFASTSAVPITAPSGPRIVTVAPISPVPVSVVPSNETVPIGASGAVRSGAVTGDAGEALPAASLCTTVSGWPSTCGVASRTA